MSLDISKLSCFLGSASVTPSRPPAQDGPSSSPLSCAPALLAAAPSLLSEPQSLCSGSAAGRASRERVSADPALQAPGREVLGGAYRGEEDLRESPGSLAGRRSDRRTAQRAAPGSRAPSTLARLGSAPVPPPGSGTGAQPGTPRPNPHQPDTAGSKQPYLRGSPQLSPPLRALCAAPGHRGARRGPQSEPRRDLVGARLAQAGTGTQSRRLHLLLPGGRSGKRPGRRGRRWRRRAPGAASPRSEQAREWSGPGEEAAGATSGSGNALCVLERRVATICLWRRCEVPRAGGRREREGSNRLLRLQSPGVAVAWTEAPDAERVCRSRNPIGVGGRSGGTAVLSPRGKGASADGGPTRVYATLSRDGASGPHAPLMHPNSGGSSGSGTTLVQCSPVSRMSLTT